MAVDKTCLASNSYHRNKPEQAVIHAALEVTYQAVLFAFCRFVLAGLNADGLLPRWREMSADEQGGRAGLTYSVVHKGTRGPVAVAVARKRPKTTVPPTLGLLLLRILGLEPGFERAPWTGAAEVRRIADLVLLVVKQELGQNVVDAWPSGFMASPALGFCSCMPKFITGGKLWDADDRGLIKWYVALPVEPADGGEDELLREGPEADGEAAAVSESERAQLSSGWLLVRDGTGGGRVDSADEAIKRLQEIHVTKDAQAIDMVTFDKVAVESVLSAVAPANI